MSVSYGNGGRVKLFYLSQRCEARKGKGGLKTAAHIPPSYRQPGNLSRTLKTMEHYGFVELKKKNGSVKPIVRATEFEIHAA